MDNKETLKILHDFQCWRRGKNMDMPDPILIGNAIDNAIRLLRKEKVKVNMSKKVYISGAIEHLDIEERKKAFKVAEDNMRCCGFEPINPFNNGVDVNADWREHMKVDIKNLLDCDYILMLKGWELSKGCKLEFDVATSCGIKVLQFNF